MSRTHASPSTPCPACGRTKSCSWLDDGFTSCFGMPAADWVVYGSNKIGAKNCRHESTARGRRNRSSLRCAAPTVRVEPSPKEATPARDWTRHHAQSVAALAESPSRNRELEILSLDIGVPVSALLALPGLGRESYDNRARTITYSWAETDGRGTVTTLATRQVYADGRDAKKECTGGPRGLTLLNGWRERAVAAGVLFPAEGGSDAIVAYAAGLPAIARPNNAAGAEQLATLLADLPAAVRIVLVGDNDEAGRACERVAQQVGDALKRPIEYAYPPKGYKDIRAWMTAGERADVPWETCGAELRDHLLSTAATYDPTAPITFDGPTKPEVLSAPADKDVTGGARPRLPKAPTGPAAPAAPARLKDYREVVDARRPTGPVWRALFEEHKRRVPLCSCTIRRFQKGNDAHPVARGKVRVTSSTCDDCANCFARRKAESMERACEAIESATGLVQFGRVSEKQVDNIRKRLSRAKAKSYSMVVKMLRDSPEVLFVVVGAPPIKELAAIAPLDCAELVAREILLVPYTPGTTKERTQPIAFSRSWPLAPSVVVERKRKADMLAVLAEKAIKAGEPPPTKLPKFWETLPGVVVVKTSYVLEQMDAIGFKNIREYDLDPLRRQFTVVSAESPEYIDAYLLHERICAGRGCVARPVVLPVTLADLDDAFERALGLAA